MKDALVSSFQNPLRHPTREHMSPIGHDPSISWPVPQNFTLFGVRVESE